MHSSGKYLAAAAALAAPALAQEIEPFSTFEYKTIWEAPEGGRASYPRVTELEDGSILVTTGAFLGGGPGAPPGPELPSFPVFKSTDGGATWEQMTSITDQVNGWGMGAQPAIMEMKEDLGDYKKGTILASGNSWNFNENEDGVGTIIDVYASTDGAKSWEFVSNVATGGRPNTTNGADPIWEPYLMMYDGLLACYYSDQRDPKHGQKLAHQTSSDLKTWGPVVNDVAYDQYIARPGMTVIAHIEPIDKWILVYELPIGNSSSHGVNYPVTYRIADSPLEFDAAEPQPIVINGDFAPNASPYVVWSPEGGECGTIVVSDADNSEVFTNQKCGDADAWEMHATPQPPAYSRALHVFSKYPDHLAIIGGSIFDEGGDPNLSLSVVSIKELVAGKWDTEKEEPEEEPEEEKPEEDEEEVVADPEDDAEIDLPVEEEDEE